MRTIFLFQDTWDLELDASGNIATATDPYSVAQDVASACRLWRGEALFNRERGIPYKSNVLGFLPPLPLIQDWYKTEAERVPLVASAEIQIHYESSDRSMGGNINITTTDGETINVVI